MNSETYLVVFCDAGEDEPLETRVRWFWQGVVDGKPCRDCLERSRETRGEHTLCDSHWRRHKKWLSRKQRSLGAARKAKREAKELAHEDAQ